MTKCFKKTFIIFFIIALMVLTQAGCLGISSVLKKPDTTLMGMDDFNKDKSDNTKNTQHDESSGQILSGDNVTEKELSSPDAESGIGEDADMDNGTETDTDIEVDTDADIHMKIDPDAFSEKLSLYLDTPEYNDIMFQNTDLDFAFVYPQDRTTIASNPYLRNESGRLMLGINIAPSGGEDLLMDYEYAYKPSIKVKNWLGTKLTEYIVFSKYDICNVTFERSTAFENKKHQVLIILTANTNTIMESEEMAGYFKENNQNCGSQKAWDLKKLDGFYNELVAGNACTLAQNWYDTFNSVLELLQINQYKGASAGYSRLLDKRIFESNRQLNYAIEASYPQFQPANSESLEETLNRYIYEDIIMENINAFKNEIEQYESQSQNDGGENQPLFNYTLIMDYSVVIYNDNLISMIMEIYPYLGGAHGMTYYKTFNFDLKNNELITLEDIFKPGFDYLTFISEYCRVELKNQMRAMGFEPDQEWIEEGTNPENKENFSNYLLTPEGLVIKFLTYQVAPNAAGDFSVLIPYK